MTLLLAPLVHAKGHSCFQTDWTSAADNGFERVTGFPMAPVHPAQIVIFVRIPILELKAVYCKMSPSSSFAHFGR